MSKQHINATRVIGAINASASGCLNVGTLADLLDMPRGKVDAAVAFLAARQLVEHSTRGCYRLTDAGRKAVETGVYKSKTGTSDHGTARQKAGATGIRARAWNALRICGALTIEAMLSRIDTGDTPNARRTVTSYLRGLIDADIVAMNRRSYVLMRNLGPVAPTVGRRHVYDPNAGANVAYAGKPAQGGEQ